MKSENGSEMKTEIKGLTTAQRQPQDAQDASRPLNWGRLGPTRGPKTNLKSIKIRSWALKGAPKPPKILPRPQIDPNRSQIDPKFIQNRREVGMQKILEIDVFPCFSTQALATWPDTKLY